MCQRLFSLHWKVVFKKLAPDDLKKFGLGDKKKKLASGDKSVRRISQEDLGKWGIIMIIVIIIEISISNIMILE